MVEKSPEFLSSYWGEKFYDTVFDRFNIGESRKLTPEEVRDVKWVLEDEYGYMHHSGTTPTIQVEKNSKSNPGIPHFLTYQTEDEFFAANGLEPYQHVFSALYPYYWYAFPKGEILKKEKVRSENVRLIQCAPATITRAAATKETEMHNRMKTRTLTNEAKVGWSPLQGNLPTELKRLTKTNWPILESDWTRFDNNMNEEVFRLVSNFKVRCLDDTIMGRKWYRDYRESLLDRSTVFPNGKVYRIRGGNPSGQFATSVDNCMVNTALTFLEQKSIYMHTVHQPTDDQDWREINKQVRKHYVSICYGDDRLLAWHPDMQESSYSTSVWSDFYSRLGMVMKPENIKFHDSVEGATFCGFTIQTIRGFYQPVFNAQKLLASLASPPYGTDTWEALGCKVSTLELLVSNQDSEAAEKIREAGLRLKIIYPEYDVPHRKDLQIMMGGPNIKHMNDQRALDLPYCENECRIVNCKKLHVPTQDTAEKVGVDYDHPDACKQHCWVPFCSKHRLHYRDEDGHFSAADLTKAGLRHHRPGCSNSCYSRTLKRHTGGHAGHQKTCPFKTGATTAFGTTACCSCSLSTTPSVFRPSLRIDYAPPGRARPAKTEPETTGKAGSEASAPPAIPH